MWITILFLHGVSYLADVPSFLACLAHLAPMPAEYALLSLGPSAAVVALVVALVVAALVVLALAAAVVALVVAAVVAAGFGFAVVAVVAAAFPWLLQGCSVYRYLSDWHVMTLEKQQLPCRTAVGQTGNYLYYASL